MSRKLALSLSLIILLICALDTAVKVEKVKASEIIYIRAYGGIDPPTAPILNVDNVTYYFTDNISDSIVVERSNIIIDGSGYTLQGSMTGTAYYLSEIKNVTIKNTSIENFTYGVEFNSASNNTLFGNRLRNTDYGVKLYRSSNNIISRNNLTYLFKYSIWLSRSSNNTISENIITNNDYGVGLSHSSNNTISENTIRNHEWCGVVLDSSSNNTLVGNDITNNNDYGVWLIQSSSNIFIRNYITNNARYGIVFDLSSDNTALGNSITDNYAGVWLNSSSNNTLSEGDITRNNDHGIRLDSSFNNTVFGNNITNNSNGVSLNLSSNNKLYHNNFISNSICQSLIYQSAGNFWDLGYPSGGNYWSDYTGTDLFCGPYQNATGFDWIGDSPHIIDETNRDNYPLIDHYVPKRHETREAYRILLERYNEILLNFKGMNSTCYSLMDELSKVRNLMYIFAATTVIFIIATVYLVTKTKIFRV